MSATLLRFCALCFVLAGGVQAAEPLKVMSFNVRYPAKSDGPNLWELRRDLFVKTVREQAPDVMGTQELFYDQGQFIIEQLPEYAWFGIGRRGTREDEHMGVFYRKAKLRLVESGHFWLSETPETPGSNAWDMSLPRMVTWGLFERTGSGQRFYFYNTHFAHRPQDEQARINSARLIAERIRKLPEGVPCILTGDFNAPAGGPAYQVFDGLLTDARKAVKNPGGPEGTFNGFKGTTTGDRIDWILYLGPVKAVEAATITSNDNGRYPSDHFPVTAVLEIGK